MSKQDRQSSRWVDFARVRRSVTLKQVIENLYKIEGLKRHGDKLVGPCPVHGGDSPRAFHADLEKNVWHCFSRCKRGGNQLDFVAAYEDISIREAALKLQEHFMASTEPAPSKGRRRRGPRSPNRDHPPREDRPDTNPPLELQLQLSRDHPHLTEVRCLHTETIERFGVGYCAKGIMRGCIAIPIHDEQGQLVAYAGRHLRPQQVREYGKYKFPKGFRKELVLYNRHRASGPTLVLVEGFFTVMKLYEAGIENVVASMGCDLSDHQARLLADATKDVIVLYDGNEAGYSGADAAKAKLEQLGVTARIARLPEDTEPDDLHPRALRWLVNGMRALDLTELSFWVRAARPDDE